MTEYISRESAAKALMTHRGLTPIARLEAATTVCQIPAADVVEVVRCKDCIYSRNDLDMSEKAAPWLLCKNLRDEAFPLMVAKTDYCCWAERKEAKITDGD